MRRVIDPRSPFPLWLVFPLIFSGIYLTHLPLLRLPYYWDEAGYYIPAAYDLFRTGSLIPHSTLSNAHPPLPSIYLALWWWASGYLPMVTRIAMCVMAALGLLAVYRIALAALGSISVAVAVVLLTALYPVWFAQSTLAHADLPAAAGALWGLALYLERTPRRARPDAEPTGEAAIQKSLWPAAVFFALAALSKETAAVTPAILASYEGLQAFQGIAERRQRLRNATWLAASLLPLCGWYAYHWRQTGFVFGNPEYLRYNATATLNGVRILDALAHRLLQLFAHMNMFAPVLCAAAAALLLAPRTGPDGRPLPGLPAAYLRVFSLIIAGNLLFFSVVGGALLTRYLLPLYPLILLVCVATLRRRVRVWPALAALSAGAFLLGLVYNPPYRFAPEDNLSYRDAIVLQQRAIREIRARYPRAVVLTAWPATDELTRPELGYLRRPMAVVRVENFSLEQIERAAAVPERYTVALVFSTKYNPPHLAWSLGERNEALDRRFFDFHRDLPPEEIARMLGGKLVWENEIQGQWAAVLHFDRAQLAGLTREAPPRRP